MPACENEQHEAFAQARFAGKTLVEAHYAAGYAGDKASASRLNQLHEVRERIAELYRERAADTAYEKSDAVRDLLAIIHTAPSDASDDHPLCEVRMGKNGPYHRLPGKLQAMSRLIKLMGWDEPVEIQVELKDNFEDMLAEIRRRPKDKPSYSSSSSSLDDPEPAANTVAGLCEPGPGANSEPAPSLPLSASPCLPLFPTPLSPRQEQFALARVKGLGVLASYHAAGYTGDTPNLASRLNAMPEIKARIAELNGGVADAVGYHKDDAIRDLSLIVRATPPEANADHPFCEMRLTSWGTYHRFPSKLGALTLLARLLGWNRPTQIEVQHDPDAGFKQLQEFISARS